MGERICGDFHHLKTFLRYGMSFICRRPTKIKLTKIQVNSSCVCSF